MEEKRIVVIDDCRLTRTIIKDILSAEGFRVFTAETGVEANSFIFTDPRPDLLIVDVEMPMLKGTDKVRLLKGQQGSSAIPVLLISGKSEEELSALSRSCGADGYLCKPVGREALLDQVGRLLPAP